MLLLIVSFYVNETPFASPFAAALSSLKDQTAAC
jgi:hypothetical protein